MSLAFFSLYPDDFEADTAHLSLAEDGAYNRLLRLCWRTHGCRIPADRSWVYRRMRAQSQDDRAVIDVVIDEFFVERDGFLYNSRLSREHEKAEANHRRLSESGRKGGMIRAASLAKATPKRGLSHPSKGGHTKASPPPPEKHGSKGGPPQPTDNAQQDAKPGLSLATQPEPEPEPYIDDDGDARARTRVREGCDQEPSLRERILDAMGLGPDGVIGASGFVGTGQDMEVVKAWLDLPNITEDDVVACVREVMARKQEGPPSRFSYFTKTIQKLSGVRSAPPLEPIAPGGPANGRAYSRREQDDRAKRLAEGLRNGTVSIRDPRKDPAYRR